jgi:hypothetical protein
VAREITATERRGYSCRRWIERSALDANNWAAKP